MRSDFGSHWELWAMGSFYKTYRPLLPVKQFCSSQIYCTSNNWPMKGRFLNATKLSYIRKKIMGDYMEITWFLKNVLPWIFHKVRNILDMTPIVKITKLHDYQILLDLKLCCVVYYDVVKTITSTDDVTSRYVTGKENKTKIWSVLPYEYESLSLLWWSLT